MNTFFVLLEISHFDDIRTWISGNADLNQYAHAYCLVHCQCMMFMFAFGAGTLGEMFGFPSVISLIIRRNRLDFRAITIIMLRVMGVFFIGRAMIHTPPRKHTCCRSSRGCRLPMMP